MKCVECNKKLTPDEIGYGHDCEVSPSSMVEYYNYDWEKEHLIVIPIGFDKQV
jgi:hypothetical protein